MFYKGAGGEMTVLFSTAMSSDTAFEIAVVIKFEPINSFKIRDCTEVTL